MIPVDQWQGGLFYIVGASGAGKDSLIRAVGALACPQDRIAIAPRYITRPVTALDPHIELSSTEFAQQHDAGRFLFSWSAYGFSYAVSAEVRDWVASGQRVLVDGSRAYQGQARQIYPDIKVIAIEADVACLPGRLQQRGRENERAISERLGRNAKFASSLERVDYRISNNQCIESAAKALLAVIRGAKRPKKLEYP